MARKARIFREQGGRDSVCLFCFFVGGGLRYQQGVFMDTRWWADQERVSGVPLMTCSGSTAGVHVGHFYIFLPAVSLNSCACCCVSVWPSPSDSFAGVDPELYAAPPLSTIRFSSSFQPDGFSRKCMQLFQLLPPLGISNRPVGRPCARPCWFCGSAGPQSV